MAIVGRVRFGSDSTLGVPIAISCTHGVHRTPALYHNIQQMVQMFNDPLHIYKSYDTPDLEIKRMEYMFQKGNAVTMIEDGNVVADRALCSAIALQLARQGTPILCSDMSSITGNGSAVGLPEYG